MNSSNNHSYNTIELILYFICIKTYKLLGTRILEIQFTSSIIKCKKSLLERIIGHVPSCIIRTTCDSLCRFYFLKLSIHFLWNVLIYILAQTGKQYDHKKQEVSMNKLSSKSKQYATSLFFTSFRLPHK